MQQCSEAEIYFYCLQTGLRFTPQRASVMIIMAVLVLHKICLQNGVLLMEIGHGSIHDN